MSSSLQGLVLTGVREADAAAAWLLRELAGLPLSPFDTPVVLAHHPALRRALTLGLARGTGCAASVRFVSPTGWIDEVTGLAGVHGEWRPGAMALRLTASLTEHVDFLPPSARHIVTSGDTVAQLEFARALALRFRAYVLYRPELLADWESPDERVLDAGGNERWQRALWRALVTGSGSRSPVQVIADVRAGRFAFLGDIPPVVLAIADPTIPPVIRDILVAVSQSRIVRWCVLAPGGTNDHARSSERLHAATRAVMTLGLSAMSPLAGNGGTLLGRVQRLLTGDAFADGPAIAIDDSLTFHVCHSPLRELETLRERLIVAFEADPSLRPHDVTLYLSSLPEYLPAVDAVFGVDESGLPRIPYEVAGRPFSDRSPVAFAVLGLLAASEGRATLEEIGALFRLPPITAAAGFTEQESNAALAWAMRAGIVWGADAADREERYDLPSVEAGTWRHGLDRLVLGVAMGRTDMPTGSVLPVAGDSAGNADLVGRVLAWTDDLFALFTELRKERDAGSWGGVLEHTLRTFVAPSGAEDYEALSTIRATMREVLDDIALASGDAPVSLAALRMLLEQALEEKAGATGHLRGGMRVCLLEKGSVLPSRVALIAGMDDALHPRGGGTPAWDLLQTVPQSEDPDKRADALDAFREAIGSTQSRVHVAWTGLTMAKHEARSPSVAVAELQELAECVLGDESRRILVRTESAHPFSAGVFSLHTARGQIQGAATDWSEAARLIGTRGEFQEAFADRTLGASPAGPRVVSLQDLSDCIADPTRFFCRKILGLRTFANDEALADREPQAVAMPDGESVAHALRPASWRLERRQRAKRHLTREEIAEWLRHQPELPYGEEGRALADAVACQWWPRLEEMHSTVWLPARPARFEIDNWTIIGRLDQLTADARVIESLYEVKPHSALKHWVSHLIMNALADRGEDVPRVTMIEDGTPWKLESLKNAENELLRLCEFYEEASVAPRPLFRKAGCAWMEALGPTPDVETNGEARAKAFTAAKTKWHRQRRGPDVPEYPGESEEAWHSLCWPDRGFDDDPEFVQAFERCTERVLRPFWRARLATEIK